MVYKKKHDYSALFPLLRGLAVVLLLKYSADMATSGDAPAITCGLGAGTTSNGTAQTLQQACLFDDNDELGEPVSISTLKFLQQGGGGLPFKHKADSHEMLAAGTHVFFNKPTSEGGVVAMLLVATVYSWAPAAIQGTSWLLWACGSCAALLVIKEVGALGMVLLFPWQCYVVAQCARRPAMIVLQYVALGLACFLGPLVATIIFAELLCKLACVETIARVARLRSWSSNAAKYAAAILVRATTPGCVCVWFALPHVFSGNYWQWFSTAYMALSITRRQSSAHLRHILSVIRYSRRCPRLCMSRLPLWCSAAHLCPTRTTTRSMGTL